MIIRCITVGEIEENCWLIVDETTKQAVLVDPGEEPDRLLAAVDAEGATLAAIWLTHAHFDHVGGIAGVLRKRPVPVWLHPLDRPIYDSAVTSARTFGLEVEQPPAPDFELAEGDTMTLGDNRFTVMHLPGHAPGHVGFLGDGVLLGGDCLFAGSIGRTDLPLANPADFLRTLERLASLPEAVRVLPGHGPATTIARELRSNPYLRQFASA
jgi:glyoxylase-like metal-dependent hydrolase (beta-lactamase superfamily II)